MAGVGVFFTVQLVYIVRHSRGFVWNRKEAISAVLTFGAVGAIFFYIYPGLSICRAVSIGIVGLSRGLSALRLSAGADLKERN
ncbi:MAG: hypothetical protein HS115_12225 [Spirochaetales bacterium]|nr:hypothetical protein [Spirochaetales bacterium]